MTDYNTYFDSCMLSQEAIVSLTKRAIDKANREHCEMMEKFRLEKEAKLKKMMLAQMEKHTEFLLCHLLNLRVLKPFMDSVLDMNEPVDKIQAIRNVYRRDIV